MQDKIIDLETKFSFQEDLLQGLNSEVVRQQRQIERMAEEIDLLKQQLLELHSRDNEHAPSEAVDEKPPHY